MLLENISYFATGLRYTFENAQERLEESHILDFIRRYDQLVEAGLQDNPATEEPPEKKFRPTKQSLGKNLWDRLHDHKDAVLAFMLGFCQIAL